MTTGDNPEISMFFGNIRLAKSTGEGAFVCLDLSEMPRNALRTA
jgi:hypothetical protein